MAEIPTHLYGTHEIHEKPRRIFLWVLWGIIGISPLVLLVMWVKDDPKFFVTLILMLLVAMLGSSILAGLRNVKKITINADEISLLPLGVIFMCSDIEDVIIIGSKPGEYMINMKIKKRGFYYYIGSFVWVGNKVTLYV